MTAPTIVAPWQHDAERRTEVLPDSRARIICTPKRSLCIAGAWWEPVFCANCGVQGPRVPEENMTFAFWLCTSCYETWGEIAGTMAMPDEVFFQTLRDAQRERYGRLLTPEEAQAELANPDSLLSTLARSRAALTPTTR
jgi:hypothetical protein